LSVFYALHISPIRPNYEILQHSDLSLTTYSVLAIALAVHEGQFLGLKMDVF